MKARKSKTLLPATLSRAEAESAFAAYAVADARRRQIMATIEQHISAVKNQYAAELTRLDEEQNLNFDLVQAYALNNRDEFGKKKSLYLRHGVIGFRTGTPKLKTLRGYTWDSVLHLTKELLPDYIRHTEDLAKDKLLAHRHQPEVNQLFGRLGIRVEQDEAFYLEPAAQPATIAAETPHTEAAA